MQDTTQENMQVNTQANPYENSEFTATENKSNTTYEYGYDPVNPFEQLEEPPIKIKSDFFLGLIGALVGSLIGVILWVLIYKIGFIAGIAGAVTVICAMQGYKILGHALDKKGVFLSIVITIIMIYVANRISWAWEIYTVYAEDPVYKISFLEAFIGVDEVVSYSNLTGVYLKDLIIGYLLTVVAGYKDVIRAFREFD
jgi:hypothetical protein